MRTLAKHFFSLLLLGATLSSQPGYSQAWNKIGISSPTTGWASTPAIAIDKHGTPYVAFLNINDQVSVMKYNGVSWITVGGANITAGAISNCGEPAPIAIDTSGAPYIAYPDTGGKATVMRYNGSSWVAVGSPLFSDGPATGITLAIDGGTPYVAYGDTGGGKATVMKYNGTTWVPVGSKRFSSGYAFLPSIAIAPDGTPYIAFCDDSHLNMISVMKYDGTTWVTVGAAHLSVGSALYPSLAIDKGGTPYVGYMDEAPVSGGATVMKYNGTSWVGVGPEGGAGAGAEFTTLALDTNGTPYVSYADYTTANHQASVTKYNGTTWVTLGSTGFSVGEVSYVPIAIDPSGTPYVAYTDTGTSVSHAAVMKFVAPANTGVKSMGNHASASISVFPDPGNGEFTINISSQANEDATVIVTNVAGAQVKELTVPTNKATQVQLSVPPGIYYLSAFMKNEKAVLKIVVE